MTLYPIDAIKPLKNQLYFDCLLHSIQTCKYRIWASVFSLNLMYNNDDDLMARRIIKELIKARKRGIDVKIIFGFGDENLSAFDASVQISARYLERNGIPYQYYGKNDPRKSSHSKYVIIDSDKLIIGSHNWGHRSFRLGKDDSIQIRSTGFNKYMESIFINNWKTE